jgi:DNA-directed RNA polymerase beta' subunit
MDAARLISLLVEIEKAVGQQSVDEVRSLLAEVEQCVFQLHQERMVILDENLRLRSTVLTMLPLMPPHLRPHNPMPHEDDQLCLMLEPDS